MRGFWETWLHIVVGLSCIAAVSGVVFMIYDIGRIHGRDEVWQTRYERGYKEGVHDGELSMYKWLKPSRN